MQNYIKTSDISKEFYCNIAIVNKLIKDFRIPHNQEQAGNLLVEKEVFEILKKTRDHYNSRIIDIETLKKHRTKLIPFNNKAYIYFLFNDEELIYIGQSISVAGRIDTHNKSKKFNYVTLISVPEKILNIVEMVYIGKYKPELNTTGTENGVSLSQIFTEAYNDRPKKYAHVIYDPIPINNEEYSEIDYNEFQY